MKLSAVLPVFAIVTMALCSTAHAAVLLSNLPGSSSGTGTNLGLGIALDRAKAVGLTTTAAQFSFDFIEVMLSNPDSFSNDVSGGIFSNVGGNPGTQLVAFTPVTILPGTTGAITTLTATTPFVLSSNTTYWFVLDGPNTTNSLQWDSLTPNAGPTGMVGIINNGYRFSSDGGASWGASSTFNGVRINASPAVVPESGTLALAFPALSLLALGILNRKKQA